MMLSKCWTAGVAILLPNVGGFLGSIPVRNNMEWYSGLKKPDWRPPNWAFAPVWTTLYSTMGYASFLVWKHGDGFHGPAGLPLMLYGGQLALNWAWTPIFFGLHNVRMGLYEILALDAAAAATAYMFYQINHRAGLMFVPYLMWLGVASSLTYVIWRDNPEGGAKITEIKDD